MDNPTHNTDNAWIDSKLAALVPPADWYPNSNRAYAQFLNRRDTDEPKAGASWIRLSMAAAILAAIGLVVTLLPWRDFLKIAAEQPGTLAKPAEVTTREEAPVQAPLASEPKPSVTAVAIIPRKATTTVKQDPPLMSQPAEAALEAEAALQATPGGAEKAPAERVVPRATPPRAIQPTVEPSYTDEARQAHIQGAVILDVIVRKDGTGKVQKVSQSLGYGLDEKAIEAFEKWKFAPGTIDGKPVDVQFQVTINFHLY